VHNQTPSKQERIYSILRERILAGTYTPGHRLVIAALARELDVSPMPVREAIRRLEAERWVVYTTNQGAEVAPVDATSWAETMTTLALLEGYATALAAPKLTDADFAQLRSTNKQMRAALAELDVIRFARRNQDFHDVIYRRCPNEYLRRLLDAALERLNTLRSTIFLYIPARGKESIKEHDQLVKLLRAAGPPGEIETFAREHKLRTLRAYEERREDDAA
jgi:DNA-binding GntR family transcriptional regulator